MNIRELWETVVLRDVLGYTFPGLVTLFALALPWFTRLEQGATCWPHLYALWTNFRWPVLGALLLLAFVVGHLQMRIIECFDEWVPGWKVGKLALRYLLDPREPMRDVYRTAGLDRFDRNAHLPAKLRGPNLDPHCVQESKVQDGAEALWKLCDYFVLTVDPATHATYMGRHYVLAVLFSNLGLSTVITAVSVTFAVWPPSLLSLGSLVVAILVACSIFLAAFALSLHRRTNQHTDRKPALRAIDTLAVALALVAFLAAPCIGRQVLPGSLLFLGLVMIYSSGHFRKQFVERAFPIFYVLSQADPDQTHPPRNPAPARTRRRSLARLGAAIGPSAFCYWLRGRISRKSD